MLNRGPLEGICARNIKLFDEKEITENDNSLVVILLSKVGENELIQTL